ncbi:astacin-like metalloprotease toxin 5 isoform X2 [Dermacentor variabilis]|uniref:astacin-like metalloprotease toxin 5 isoform X2 n=1 Tax=Dermacentor variabilis TaxID=34621 RepID=UPI003F5C183F
MEVAGGCCASAGGSMEASRSTGLGKSRRLRGRYPPATEQFRRYRTTKKILRAMADIESQSCLRFVARRRHQNYLYIMRGDGCTSFVGRQGGAQEVSLGTGCLYRATIVHELMHAVGFDHEHSRSDRDQYIDVFTENAEPENVEQFDKLEPWENRLLTPFDRDSVMLYGSESFAREPGLATMLAKDGSRLKEVYDKRGLSASDARRINMLYRCKNKKT